MSFEKNISSVFLFVACAFTLELHAQDDAPEGAPDGTQQTLYLVIKNTQNLALSNVTVWLTDVKSNNEEHVVTDIGGKVSFQVVKSSTYWVGFKDNKNHTEIKVPAYQSTPLTKAIIYTPPLEVAPTIKVSTNTKLDTIRQEIPVKTIPKSTECLITIEVLTPANVPVKNMDVRLLCNPQNRLFIARTSNMGKVIFLVNAGNKCDLGIETLNNYQSFDLPLKGGAIISRSIKFEPSIAFTEEAKKDTIRQVLPLDAYGTSLRAFVNVTVNNYENLPLPDENIYVNVAGSTTVYFATTNSKGVANFLLPKGAKYILNFKYDRDVATWNYSDKKGIANATVEYTYIGSKKIEAFYKNAERNDDGFLKEFMEVKLGEKQIEKPNVVEKTKDGFIVDLAKENLPRGPILPPTVNNNRIFVSQGGYYNNYFCSLNALTGILNWSVTLQEGGVSASVCESEVVLLITESCTLYALDANSGKLLWSKWLSAYMFSSPTAKDNYVYAVYPNDLNSESAKFVLGCFEIKTGKTVWQNWLDADILGAAVENDGLIYATTMRGSLYQFDGKTGKLLGVQHGSTVTMPTITKEKIFVRQLEPASNKNTRTVFYTKNLKISKATVSSPGNPDYLHPDNCLQRMYYCGSRTTNCNGLNYIISTNSLTCSDPESQKTMWSQTFYSGKSDIDNYKSSCIPVIAGNKVLVVTPDNFINIYDSQTGVLAKQYHPGKNILSQPIVNNGWMYIGSEDGFLVAINTQDPSLSGWNTWCGNSSHNTFIK